MYTCMYTHMHKLLYKFPTGTRRTKSCWQTQNTASLKTSCTTSPTGLIMDTPAEVAQDVTSHCTLLHTQNLVQEDLYPLRPDLNTAYTHPYTTDTHPYSTDTHPYTTDGPSETLKTPLSPPFTHIHLHSCVRQSHKIPPQNKNKKPEKALASFTRTQQFAWSKAWCLFHMV